MQHVNPIRISKPDLWILFYSYQHVGNICKSRALPAWLVIGRDNYEERITNTYVNSTSKILCIRRGAITNNSLVLFSSFFRIPVNDLSSWSHSIDTNVLIQWTPTCCFYQLVGVLLIDTNILTATSTYFKLTLQKEHCDKYHLQSFQSAKYIDNSWTWGCKLRIADVNW